MPNTNGSEERRFGFSALSKSKSDIAYEEEILGDKYTGEFLFKTPVKDLISFDYNSRVSSHIEHTELHSNTLGLFGKVYCIDNEGIYIFPCVVPFNTNILDSDVKIPATITSKLVFSIDLDCLTIIEDEVSKVIDAPSIQFNLTIRDNNLEEHSIIREIKLTELNKTIFNIKTMLGDDKESNEVILNSIKVTPNVDLDPDLNKYRLILYNICMVLA